MSTDEKIVECLRKFAKAMKVKTGYDILILEINPKSVTLTTTQRENFLFTESVQREVQALYKQLATMGIDGVQIYCLVDDEVEEAIYKDNNCLRIFNLNI